LLPLLRLEVVERFYGFEEEWKYPIAGRDNVKGVTTVVPRDCFRVETGGHIEEGVVCQDRRNVAVKTSTWILHALAFQSWAALVHARADQSQGSLLVNFADFFRATRMKEKALGRGVLMPVRPRQFLAARKVIATMLRSLRRRGKWKSG